MCRSALFFVSDFYFVLREQFFSIYIVYIIYNVDLQYN